MMESQTPHRPLTSLDEEEMVEMSQVDQDTRGSWLLHSESEDEAEDISLDEENGLTGSNGTPLQHRQRRKIQRRRSDGIFSSAIKHVFCFRLFFCCKRRTFKIFSLVTVLVMSFVSFGLALRSNTCWTARDELFLLNRFDQNSANVQQGPWPLKSAHSHNDYQQIVPFREALLAGFCSVEGDVYLLDGVLYLGHMVASTGTSTLEGSYIKPLKDLIKANGGFVYKRSVKLQTCLQVTLLVDIKSNDIVETWQVLETLLKSLDEPLGDGRPTFETFDNDRNVILPNDTVFPSPVKVVVTGLADKTEEIAQRMASRSEHKTSLDLNYESSSPATVRAARWISEKYPFPFPDTNPTSVAQTKKALQKRVHFAHTNGMLVRFWGTPENPDLWDMLLENGVDLINTDSIFTLHSYLIGRSISFDNLS